MNALTAEEARRLGLNPATLRKWVQRGYIHKHGRDQYDLGDVWAMLVRRPGCLEVADNGKEV